MTKANSSSDWFSVDKDGLKEMFANFPFERLVMELIQNTFDVDSTICKVNILQDADANETFVSVIDDNPDGFKNLRDAYTLFGTTDKRSDPTKRGRFSFGEKIVLARAKHATIRTTKGTVSFTKAGRHNSSSKTSQGSCVDIVFKKWTNKEFDHVLASLKLLYPPKGIKFTVNDVEIPYVEPYKQISSTMSTEFLKTVEGQAVMTKTTRKTDLYFYKARSEKAYLYEMGLPVCEIEGLFDVDVQQKVPLSHDRTLVPQSYLQDVYAELLKALGDEMPADVISSASMRMAMEDERTDPETAAKMFKKSFGDNAYLQSHNPDADQEAARQGASMISSRTFGADVNAKLREGGIQTTLGKFCKDVAIRMDGGIGMPSQYKSVEVTPDRANLAKYTQMLCKQFYKHTIDVQFAHWMDNNIAAMKQGDTIIFNVFRLGNELVRRPVTQGTAIVLHELAHHCNSSGHDGVYDFEFERLVNKHTQLMVTNPELYKAFEPTAFKE